MANEMEIWHLIMNAGLVVKGVLILLLLLSVICWGIMLSKWRLYRRIRHENEEFLSVFWSGKDMDNVLSSIPQRYPNSPLPNIFQAGYREFIRHARDRAQVQQNKIVATGGLDGIRRAMDAALSREMEMLSNSLSFLATVGSTAPFIGLFGTVWGITNAFQNIGITQNTSLAAVAPGIAEALIATAFGLIAAIPAVIAYNKFNADTKRTAASMDQFSSEFINILSRHIKA
ncbi:MAG: protein TolQ [Mariprofundaceae bacterium]|nr:protein TolQ [Mariprofundaceae bacterium]